MNCRWNTKLSTLIGSETRIAAASNHTRILNTSGLIETTTARASP